MAQAYRRRLGTPTAIAFSPPVDVADGGDALNKRKMMFLYWSLRASLLALLLGLMSVPASADDNKNESGKGYKRSAEAHQRDSGRSAVNPRDSLGANESVMEERNLPSYVPGERRDEERSERETRRDGYNERYAQDLHSATLPIPNSPSCEGLRDGLASLGQRVRTVPWMSMPPGSIYTGAGT